MRAKLSTTEQADYRAWAQTHGRGVSQSLNFLRWKLYRKAKNERRFRFYTLYDRVWRRDTLETAWRLVAREGKAAGVDGVTAEAVLARENGVDEFLTGVQEQLRSNSYRPAPIRRVYHNEMNSKLESPALKFAGEPSTGNLSIRFDEGRGGLAFGLAPSSALPVDLQPEGKAQ